MRTEYVEPVFEWKKPQNSCALPDLQLLQVVYKAPKKYEALWHYWRRRHPLIGLFDTLEKAKAAAEQAYRLHHRKEWLRGLECDDATEEEWWELLGWEWEQFAPMFYYRRLVPSRKSTKRDAQIITGFLHLNSEIVNAEPYKTLGEALDAANDLARICGGWLDDKGVCEECQDCEDDEVMGT